jgi:hypothetical protein
MSDSILKTLYTINGTRKSFFTYGRFDIVIFIESSNYKELRKITSKINEIEGVRSTETLAEA